MDAASTNAVLSTLACEHHGVFLGEMARRQGVSENALRRRTVNGALVRVDHDIYRVAGTPTTTRQRALVACWSQGPDALLSHRAAAMLWGLDGVDQAPLEVLVPRWRRRQRRSDVRVHECTDLIGADRSIVDGIPCTSVVRTLLDAIAVLPLERGDQLVEDALRRRQCTVDALASRFSQVARRGRPGTKKARQLIEKRHGCYLPTMSEFERRMSDLVQAIGLTPPVRQHPVRIREGVAYLDLAWPEVLVGVECDGLFHHGSNLRLPWDDDRQNELVLQGWLILRFTWHQLIHQPDVVQAQLIGALRARGLAHPVPRPA
jgi:very-short-patch-repair endonuclease